MKNIYIFLIIIAVLFSGCKMSQAKIQKIYDETTSYNEKGDWEKAYETLDKIPKKQRDWNYYLNYGLIMRNKSTYFSSGFSLNYFKKAYELNPDNEETLFFLGQTYNFMEEYQLAYEYISKAVDYIDESSDDYYKYPIYYTLVEASFGSKKYEEAAKYLQKCKSLKKTSYLAMWEGVIKSRIENKDLLDSYFNAAKEIKDEYDAFTEQLYANEKTFYGNYETAIAHYENLIKKHPKDSGNYSLLGGVYLQIGKLDKAYEVLKQSKELFTTDKVLFKNFAIYYYLTHDTKEMLSWANAYLRANVIEIREIASEEEFVHLFQDDITFMRAVGK